MTDPDLVAKKLALIETYVRELRTLAKPAAIEHDVQIAVQACQDVASHIVSDERLGEPRARPSGPPRRCADHGVAPGALAAGAR